MEQKSLSGSRSTPMEGARVKATLDNFCTKIQSVNNTSSETLQLIKEQQANEGDSTKTILRDMVGPPLKKLLKLSTAIDSNVTTMNETLQSTSITVKENQQQTLKYLEGKSKKSEKNQIELMEKVTAIGVKAEAEAEELSSKVAGLQEMLSKTIEDQQKLNEQVMIRIERAHRQEIGSAEAQYQKLSQQFDQLADTLAPLLHLVPIICTVITQQPLVATPLSQSQRSSSSSKSHPTSRHPHSIFSDPVPSHASTSSYSSVLARVDAPLPNSNESNLAQAKSFPKTPLSYSQPPLIANPDFSFTPPNPFNPAFQLLSVPLPGSARADRANCKPEFESSTVAITRNSASSGIGSSGGSARKKRRIEQSESEAEEEEELDEDLLQVMTDLVVEENMDEPDTQD